MESVLLTASTAVIITAGILLAIRNIGRQQLRKQFRKNNYNHKRRAENE